MERGWFVRLLVLLLLCTVEASARPAPQDWVPIRWTGGPLEIAWRTRTNKLPDDAAVRAALAHWYEPTTLNVLEDSPANCLLVTWIAPGDAAVEAEQRNLVKLYADAAHKRGLAVLGLVYGGGDVAKIVANTVQAELDGLVLDGEFPRDFAASLRKAAGPILVIEIGKEAAPWRWSSVPIVAIEGVAPSGRNLSEMGIRGAPSSEPWIESNIWLVRSFGIASPAPQVWISSHFEHASQIDQERSVADAAVAGGRWIISLDDALRAKLAARDAPALAQWRALSSYLKFAEGHLVRHALIPYGNVGIVLDAAAEPSVADEYLKLTVRRQVPYRLLPRSALDPSALENFRALLLMEVKPPSGAERRVLENFVESGALLITGPGWGGAPGAAPFAETAIGKGRLVVYNDPDPESVARDLKELLSDDDLGVVPFNVPSVITSASGGRRGEPLVIQLLNYFDHPVEMITLRAAGNFRSAHLDMPDAASIDLPVRQAGGRTEVTIPKLPLWGVVSMQ